MATARIRGNGVETGSAWGAPDTGACRANVTRLFPLAKRQHKTIGNLGTIRSWGKLTPSSVRRPRRDRHRKQRKARHPLRRSSTRRIRSDATGPLPSQSASARGGPSSAAVRSPAATPAAPAPPPRVSARGAPLHPIIIFIILPLHPIILAPPHPPPTSTHTPTAT